MFFYGLNLEGCVLEKERVECVDAGSEYCPCYLAEINDCITCAHLQGKSFCDCKWSGVCIYQEFYRSGYKRKDTRKTCEANIIEKKVISDDLILFKVGVTKTLARQLKQPGSYVFIRDINKPMFFDTPMSIMNADEYKGEIEIAVQIVGSKTKCLKDCTDKILLKGPYWNGVLGIKNLKMTKESNVLLVARGVALAPAVLAIKYLLKNKNKITFVMDPGWVGDEFIHEYIKDIDMEVVKIDLKQKKDRSKFLEMVKNGDYDLVYSAGSDEVHYISEGGIEMSEKEIKFVKTNNVKICCGEGICGACTFTNQDGKTIKMCKAQLL